MAIFELASVSDMKDGFLLTVALPIEGSKVNLEILTAAGESLPFKSFRNYLSYYLFTAALCGNEGLCLRVEWEGVVMV